MIVQSKYHPFLTLDYIVNEYENKFEPTGIHMTQRERMQFYMISTNLIWS